MTLHVLRFHLPLACCLGKFIKIVRHKRKMAKMSIKWGFILENYHIFVVYSARWCFSCFVCGGEKPRSFRRLVSFCCCCWMNINTHFFCVSSTRDTQQSPLRHFHPLSPLVLTFRIAPSSSLYHTPCRCFFPAHFTYLKFSLSLPCFFLLLTLLGCYNSENHKKWIFRGWKSTWKTWKM